MELADIKAAFRSHWKPGWGSVTAEEAYFIQLLMRQHRPCHFIEIGMASGLSGGLIAQFLEENGGGTLTTLDHDNTFFGDTTKPNGFLLDEIYTGERVTVAKMPFKTALDIPTMDRRFDMAFVDANHQHPWPTIDTLCLYPFMSGSKIVVHHDLKLFRKQDVVYGIGPKYLWDQFRDNERIVGAEYGGNIFAINLDMEPARFEEIVADSLSLPWSLRTPLQEGFINAIRSTIERFYSRDLLEVFDYCLNKFNMIERFRTGV